MEVKPEEPTKEEQNHNLNEELQRFAYQTSLISGLQKGGKLSAREAFKRIRRLWRELKKYKPAHSEPSNDE